MSAAPQTLLASPPAKKERFQQDQVNSTERLYRSKNFSDVNFLFVSDDGTALESIAAHKNLLAADSDVFEKMFYGGLNETGDVTIVDASAAAFKEFLQFFYFNDVRLSNEHMAEVMQLGDKYNVKKCVNKCVDLLKNDLTNENVCTILPLIRFDDEGNLAKICEKQILLHTDEVFASSGFLGCSKAELAHILQMKFLPCSEVDVFEACMAWVRAKSKEKTVTKAMVAEYLGDLYYEIRFVSMSTEEVCSLKRKYDAVLSDDFEAIIRLIVRLDIHSERFNSLPREAAWNPNAVMTCDRKSYNTLAERYVLDIEEKITFSSNQPIVLGKFQMRFGFVSISILIRSFVYFLSH